MWVEVSCATAPAVAAYRPSYRSGEPMEIRSWSMAVPCGHPMEENTPAAVVERFQAKLSELIEKHRPPTVH